MTVETLAEARARRTRQILRLGALKSASAREQLRLLRAARRDVLAALADATGFRAFHLAQVLTQIFAEIDRRMAIGRTLAQRAATDATSKAFDLGIEAVDAVLRAARAEVSIPTGVYGISQRLLAAVIDVTTDQVRGVYSELGRTLKGAVRRAALGIEDPFAAMTAIARRIADPKTFGTAEVRAEAIIRTEVGRTFAVSQQRRNEESAERLEVVGLALGKWWLPVGDARTREEHKQAGRDYSEARAIAHDEPFVVGGERLMFPLDPNGSAWNTVNCRCSAPSVVMKAARVRAA